MPDMCITFSLFCIWRKFSKKYLSTIDYNLTFHMHTYRYFRIFAMHHDLQWYKDYGSMSVNMFDQTLREQKEKKMNASL